MPAIVVGLDEETGLSVRHVPGRAGAHSQGAALEELHETPPVPHGNRYSW